MQNFHARHEQSLRRGTCAISGGSGGDMASAGICARDVEASPGMSSAPAPGALSDLCGGQSREEEERTCQLIHVFTINRDS